MCFGRPQPVSKRYVPKLFLLMSQSIVEDLEVRESFVMYASALLRRDVTSFNMRGGGVFEEFGSTGGRKALLVD
jgi:hypothetical protein